jgi:hypothetical protein
MENFVGWKKFKNFSGRKIMLVKWLLIFTFSLPAWGYNLTRDFTDGFYWASLPINIQVEDSVGARANDIFKLAEESIRDWESATGLSLWDINSSGTSNLIRWSTNFAAETRMDPNSVLAVAVRYTNGPYFAKTEIVINGSHPSFNTNFPTLNKTNLKTTLVHELGHTMGLDHSNNMSAIMAPSLQPYYTGIHSDDRMGMEDAHSQMEHRQLTRYVSPLSYSSESTSAQALSCGTTGPLTSGPSANSVVSLMAGMLIGFVRKIFRWFKSKF